MVNFSVAIEINERCHGEWHVNSLPTMEAFADFQRAQESGSAIEILIRVLHVYHKVIGPNNIRTTTCLHYLGKAHAAERNYTLAIENYVKATDIVELYLGVDHIKGAEIMKDLGEVYLTTSRPEMARDMLVRAERAFRT